MNEQKPNVNSENFDNFGYSPGTNVAVPANLFMSLRNLLKAVRENGTVISFKTGQKNPEEFATQNPDVTLTPEAFNSVIFLGYLDEIHISNIEKGIAVDLTKGEINAKPTIESPVVS